MELIEKKQLEIMYHKFLESGYPTQVLEHAFSKALSDCPRASGSVDRPLCLSIHTIGEPAAIKRNAECNLNVLQSDGSLGPNSC